MEFVSPVLTVTHSGDRAVSAYQASTPSAPALLTQNVLTANMVIILMELVACGRTPIANLMIKIIIALLAVRAMY
jgi:hypothetical protein